MLNLDNIKKYDVFFFDIFDTIVSRTVQPEFTKKIWCNHLIKYFNLNLNMVELYNYRAAKELELYYNARKNQNDSEFRYKDLIQEIYKEFIYDIYDIKYSLFESICEEIEVEIECNVQILDDEIVRFIKEIKKANKKIYCISDMYLSKEMISKIFMSHGIYDLIDDIFVSSEYLKNKKTGNLYKYVLQKLKINPQKCLMIGDNEISDFKNPQNLNMDAIHLDRSELYKKYDEYLINNNFENIEKKFKKISTATDNFEHIVFSLYTFIEKLYYKLLSENKKEVFFLSREGEFLKKLFDLYVKKINNKKIDTHYLIVSRKSTYLPSLKELKKENFSYLLDQYSYITIREFLKSLNFTDKEIKEIDVSFKNYNNSIIENLMLNTTELNKVLEVVPIDFDKKIAYFKDSNALKRLIKNEVFSKIYEKKRLEQNKNFNSYIKQFTESKDIAIVDIGWNGTIQDNIQNILGNSYKIEGYYLGLNRRNNYLNTKKTGLLFSNVPEINNEYTLYNENRAIYEILLGASHGSANKYINNNNYIEVELFSKKEEKEIYDNIISNIQNDMFNIFEQLVDIFANGFYNNKDYTKKFNNIHFKMIFSPTKKQLNFFNKIYHYENFGFFGFTKFNHKNKYTFTKWIKENIKSFIRKSYLYDSFWPMIKLYNNKLYIQMMFYRIKKKISLKMKGVL